MQHFLYMYTVVVCVVLTFACYDKRLKTLEVTLVDKSFAIANVIENHIQQHSLKIISYFKTISQNHTRVSIALNYYCDQ